MGLVEDAQALRARIDNAESLEELRGVPRNPAKAQKWANLVDWHHTELDTLLGPASTAGSIADLTAQIDVLAATANRTVAQTARLDNLRDARTDARRWVRTVKLVLLLDGSVVRGSDLGAD